ncbi:MAG: tetratricopeptide repeat protein [Saprospiraceae bacterium]|nr:tetratricopeptide repeat protein [Saprospiraceae bacterium]MCF8249064.1 tetratricopeptide repeat protein [Saprospiraceae bacterium]MCF8280931.1 tetratricopeptide repeat protein [Bacteroidales bacterium]MCF8311086.1 tetratricopeptide repeat protein [Saprospiraceae bacterium]MCF8440176.1 tetratricopeptide repeat protein [Saprospiraceae bacterium]
MNNLLPHFIQEQLLAGKRHGNFQAYTVFVDMSGFTRLTETLLKQGNAGAERISNILNAIFEPMVRQVYAQGGFIPYFAGDAFTGIFLVDQCDCDATKLLALAQRQFELLETASANFGEFKIGIKTGLSFGKVEWGIVGDAHKSFFFRGPAIAGSANGQMQAQQQQIIVDQAYADELPQAAISLTPCAASGFFVVNEKPDASDLPLPASPKLPALKPEVLAQFLPKTLLEFTPRGEFRTVVSVFISFEGLAEYEHLNSFATEVLNQINNFSGYFKEIDFSDKGGVIVAFFGAPVSYENNVERALEFVLALQDELLPLQIQSGLRFKAGIAEGIAYAGVIGGVERSQYAAVGNRVNIAARLMMSAEWGEVLVDEALHKNRNFRFQHTGDISYKGLNKPIPTYKLAGRNQEQRRPFDGAMVGRELELDQLEVIAMQAFESSEAAISYVYGEAGIGKTRLSYELRNRLRKRRSPYWMVCQSDQILRKPFNPFIHLLKNYFGQKPTNSPEANLQSFETEFKKLLGDLAQTSDPTTEGIKREVVRTKPVLAALTGLKTTDSFWNNLDAKGRYQNTLAALSALVQSEALLGPVVLELEDGHWFDDSSKEFLGELVGRIRQMPVFVLVTSRYDDEGNKPKLFSEAILEKHGLSALEFDLNILDGEAMKGFANERLKGKISPELLELLMRTTNGNPFYAEQMLEYFVESGQLVESPKGWMVKDQNVRVSNSIQAVLTARIDRLSSLVKETIKAAAVIGREFELPVLTEVMLANEELVQQNGNSTAVLKEQVKTAERAQIWQAMNELRYIFRHSLLREAVYDMQLKTRIKELHQHIAEAIEKLYENNLEQRYVDLVFHYEQAEDEAKLQEYLRKAADYAKEYYQNQQALIFYDKLIVILEKQGNYLEKAKTLLKKSSILELIGRWEEAEILARESLVVADEVKDSKVLGRANDALGHLLMLKGRYDEADRHLETAAAFFGSSHDDRGTSKVYGHLGTLYFRQGKYEDAKLYFIRSIQMAQLHPHTSSLAQIVATLGLTYMNLGKYDDGIRWQQSQLEACQKVNDRQGMATLLTNLGIVYFEKGEYDEALDCYQRGLDLAEELGNKQLTSIAIGCIGMVWQRKGRFDLAEQHFERDLALTEELGDKQGTCIALGLMGDLYSVMGKFDEAIGFMERNLKLGEELGYRKGVAKSLNTLGDIYFFKNELDTSINFYDRSIETTRSIGNKLVLGFSLVEKANVLLAKGNLDEVLEHLREATALAADIKHPDLVFEVRLMAGKLAIRKNNVDEAINVFDALLALKRGRRDEAMVQSEYSKIETSKEHKERALTLFKELYKETPVHVYHLKINELEGQAT